MSICDRIVVMKDGIVQQVGAPQQVYDDPANLFVAQFLGTPPIHVFDGQIRGGQLCLGDAPVLETPDLPDGPITAAIRPEAFVPNVRGSLTCRLTRVEVMGRDVSVLCSHSACTGGAIRAIIDSDCPIDSTASTISFSLKSHKVFLFDRTTGQRIR